MFVVETLKQRKQMENKCTFCGHKNPEDNFICEGDDCGAPLDLHLSFDDFGLPIIINK